MSRMRAAFQYAKGKVRQNLRKNGRSYSELLTVRGDYPRYADSHHLSVKGVTQWSISLTKPCAWVKADQLKKLENVAKADERSWRTRSPPSRRRGAQGPDRRSSSSEIENGETLDELMPEAFATVREALQANPGPAPLRRAAHGRRRPALGQHRRNEDR